VTDGIAPPPSSRWQVYIIDKTENNPLHVDGHPAWASEYTLSTNAVRAMPVRTNTFCAGGASLGDGRWINVGGNQVRRNAPLVTRFFLVAHLPK
jgi:hypothetical protein